MFNILPHLPYVHFTYEIEEDIKIMFLETLNPLNGNNKLNKTVFRKYSNTNLFYKGLQDQLRRPQ